MTFCASSQQASAVRNDKLKRSQITLQLTLVLTCFFTMLPKASTASEAALSCISAADADKILIELGIFKKILPPKQIGAIKYNRAITDSVNTLALVSIDKLSFSADIFKYLKKPTSRTPILLNAISVSSTEAHAVDITSDKKLVVEMFFVAEGGKATHVSIVAARDKYASPIERAKISSVYTSESNARCE